MFGDGIEAGVLPRLKDGAQGQRTGRDVHLVHDGDVAVDHGRAADGAIFADLGAAGDAGTGGNGNPGGTNCSPVKSAAENIAIFPADNPWNKDISASPIDPYNTQIIAALGTNAVKADFGSGLWQGAPIGIPYIVVCGNQPRITIHFTDYGDESDPGPYPIPLNAPIEGNGAGDSHVIAVDVQNKKLYELFYAHVNGNQWDASSGAIFDLASNQMRPEGWTSADAAGLPIFPGLVRYEEILKGEIDHPIRFTLTSNNVKPAYIYPARHKVNSSGGIYSLPFGARIRLKASVDISGYSATNQIILRVPASDFGGGAFKSVQFGARASDRIKSHDSFSFAPAATGAIVAVCST